MAAVDLRKKRDSLVRGGIDLVLVPIGRHTANVKGPEQNALIGWAESTIGCTSSDKQQHWLGRWMLWLIS